MLSLSPPFLERAIYIYSLRLLSSLFKFLAPWETDIISFSQSVQNELVSLNLQFNMAEDRAKRLEKENQELIDRWMDRMGKEADAMNNASKFS